MSVRRTAWLGREGSNLRMVESKSAASKRWRLANDPTLEATPYHTARKLRIVSVDDDLLVSFNTSAMLEDLGHTVFTAGSGARALEILQREDSIDLLITDQGMPGMTGAELAAKVRAEKPDLPVIIATGFAELARGEGAEYPKLSKPFMQHDLANVIAKVISPSKNRARS
jgi:CheY-like chemotaxis protein